MEKSAAASPTGTTRWRSVFRLYLFVASTTAILSLVLLLAFLVTMESDARYINILTAGFIVLLAAISAYHYRLGRLRQDWLYRFCRFRRAVEKAVNDLAAGLEKDGFAPKKISSFPGFSINPWVPVARIEIEKASLSIEISTLMAGSMGSVATTKTGPFLLMLQGRNEQNEKEAGAIMRIIDSMC